MAWTPPESEIDPEQTRIGIDPNNSSGHNKALAESIIAVFQLPETRYAPER